MQAEWPGDSSPLPGGGGGCVGLFAELGVWVATQGELQWGYLRDITGPYLKYLGHLLERCVPLPHRQDGRKPQPALILFFSTHQGAQAAEYLFLAQPPAGHSTEPL